MNLDDVISDYSDLEADEKRALKLTLHTNGITQSQLWKQLDVSAQIGSKLARSLDEQGFVNRKKTTKNGSQTFYLEPTVKTVYDLDFSLLLAADMLPPFVGDDDVDVNDDAFTQYIMTLHDEYQRKENAPQ